jgi:hypothetical protein
MLRQCQICLPSPSLDPVRLRNPSQPLREPKSLVRKVGNAQKIDRPHRDRGRSLGMHGYAVPLLVPPATIRHGASLRDRWAMIVGNGRIHIETVSRKNSRAILRRSAYLTVFFSKPSKRFSSISIRRQRRIGNKEHQWLRGCATANQFQAREQLLAPNIVNTRASLGREDLQATLSLVVPLTVPRCNKGFAPRGGTVPGQRWLPRH